MKKRLLCLLLVAAMLASMTVIPVFAEDVSASNVTAMSEMCPCGCGGLLSQVAWKAYDANNTGAPSTGHYYLADDYAQNGQYTLISGSNVVIDLRGKTLTSSGYSRLFLVEGYLAVLDTVGGGRIQSKTSGSAYGGVIMVRENETKGSAFEMYSGTLTVDPDNKGSLAGGVVYVSGDQSAFRMYGGVITGGSTTKHGGNIAVVTATAKAEILGGVIMEGSAATSGGSIYSIGTTVLKNCKILGGTAAGNGGNIYQKGGSLTMENCEIAYGTANGDGGGNIYVAGSAAFTDNGSTIRDGASLGGSGSGGNVLFGAGTHTLTGTTIRGGVTQLYGANVVNWTATTTRMIDCSIDGDVRWSGAGLSLEGKTKIGLRGNGLNLVGGGVGSVISAAELTDGAEVFVSAHYGTFTNDSVNADYFKPALRTVLTQNTDGTLSGDEAASGEVGGYCPHCYDPEDPQKVTWTAYTAATDSDITESGHYYLSDSATARLNIAAGKDVVIDLNGRNITSGHRCFVMGEGAALSLVDFNGAGKVTGKGGATVSGETVTYWNGGVFYGSKPYDLNIYCGTYTYTSQADKHVASGGVIYAPAGSNVNIYGGTLDGSSYNATETGNIGGAVRLADGASTFNMSAGRVLGGNAYQGGAMCFGKSADVDITGGVISGGSVANGSGNIRFAGASGAKGSANLKDCAVLDGVTAAGYSGNMHIYYYTVDMDNCYIHGGVNETVYGGNISCSSGSVTTASDSIIAGGKAAKGGNLYTATTDARATFTDCMILDGEAFVPEGSTASTDGYGGNLFANNGVITFEGGVVSGGRAARAGGNVHNNAGNAAAGTDNKVVWKKGTDVPQLTGGRAGTYGGNAHLAGVTELQAVYIAGGLATTSGDDLYLPKGTKTSLTVESGAVGEIRMGVAEDLLGTGVYGQPVSATVADTLNMVITLEGDYGEPRILAENGALCVGAVSVVDAAGAEIWYADNAEAVAACGENEYVKLYTDDDLVLTKDLTVDLNGHTVTVSGDHKLFGMDSSGDGYALPTGKATGAANAAPITRAPNGNLYLMVAEGEDSVYHRLGMKITDIALRPSEAGLYYKAAWSCDSVLDGLIDEYGIVASVEDMPGADFRDETDENEWVAFDSVTDGEKKCGVLIRDIMQQENGAAVNETNGEMPIYATAYVTMTDGTTYISDGAGVSLYAFMEALDGLIQADPIGFRRFEKAAKEFYDAWDENGMGNWTFTRLKAPVDPAEDGVFNLLMIGSSGCYYYVEELYALFKEAGIEARICNVYYSGGLLSQHYNWWKDGKSNYQFFVTDATGRHKISNEASLEYCLAQYNWDVITLQESGAAKLRVGEAQTLLAEREVYLTALYGYLGEQFPQAKLMWQENRAFAVGYEKAFTITSVQEQAEDTRHFREFAQAIAEKYDIKWIPSGEGLQNFREDSGLPDTLTARLGVGTNHEGDYYHDGDIGGGQLLTASVWFESLTGISCLNSNYVPVYIYGGEEYTLSEELVTAVRAAAHKAVQEWFVTQ